MDKRKKIAKAVIAVILALFIMSTILAVVPYIFLQNNQTQTNYNQDTNNQIQDENLENILNNLIEQVDQTGGNISGTNIDGNILTGQNKGK